MARPNDRQATLLHTMVELIAAEGGPVTVAQVAGRLGVPCQSTMHACRRRGWVESEVDGSRQTLWRVTVAGMAVTP